MPAWILTEVNSDETAARLGGYAVHDALGIRLGYVSGWITDPNGAIRMLKVSVTEWEGASDYLVPLGAVTLVSDTKSLVQLRDVTKQSIGRRCYRYRGDLPEPRLLSTLQRHFKPPRTSVVERLSNPPAATAASGPSWTRMADMALPIEPREARP